MSNMLILCQALLQKVCVNNGSRNKTLCLDCVNFYGIKSPLGKVLGHKTVKSFHTSYRGRSKYNWKLFTDRINPF